MSNFAKILHDKGNFTEGAKGAKNYTTTGMGVVDLNNKVIQGSDNQTINTYFNKAFDEINHNNDPEMMMRLIITIINKRDFRRGGEGCRRIYYRLMLELYNSGYKQLVIDMIKFMPDIGYYDDWTNIVKEINTFSPKTKQTSTEHIEYFKHYDPLIKEIGKCYFSQIEKDNITLKNNGNKISLIGKWGPRENKSKDLNIFWYIPLYKKEDTDEIKGLYKQGWVNWLTRYRYLDSHLIFGKVVDRIPGRIHAMYRKSLSNLNKFLKTPEIMMCSKQYSEIRFESAASKFLNKSMSALLNEKRKTHPPPHMDYTGNRYPNDPDRIDCRNNFIEYLPKIKASAVDFYEIISKVLKTESSTQQKVLRAQWDAKVKNVREEINKFREELYGELQELCKVQNIKCPPKPNYPDIIPLIDCSGSMGCNAQAPGSKGSLTCLQLAVSLGMAFADVNEGPFSCMSISYSSTPILINLPRTLSLKERYYRITAINACSTNYLSTQELIVDYAYKNKIPQTELPETYCFSDEGFDVQIQGLYNNYYSPYNRQPTNNKEHNWNTTYESIQKIYKQSGYDIVPMTYFHNLSANNYYGHQAEVNRKGVSMLQGYTSSTFKYAFVGNLPAQLEAMRPKKDDSNIPLTTELSNEKKSTKDDFEAMINRPHFDIFKCLLHFSNEGVLKDYKFDKIDKCPELPTIKPPPRDAIEIITTQFDNVEITDIPITSRQDTEDTEDTEEKTWTDTILGVFW
tara:strand:- start:316 stop:2529 length:2214 start_codon:yes stop_codon:yes gene_type:complete